MSDSDSPVTVNSRSKGTGATLKSLSSPESQTVKMSNNSQLALQSQYLQLSGGLALATAGMFQLGGEFYTLKTVFGLGSVLVAGACCGAAVAGGEASCCES